MMPRTLNNMAALEVLSALQKHIRRGEEREAMACACELGHTSKAYFSMLVNRLEIIAHEDIGLANVEAVMFTATAVEQAKRHYDAEKPGKWRMMVGNAIRLLCRGPKSREGDHFQAAVGLAALIDHRGPTIPDYAHDQHTTKGRRAGCDLAHFRAESTKLVPPADPDRYEDEAYAAWARRDEAKAPNIPGRKLFGDEA